MEEKISVIVPVYNVAKYLERCVTSILSQTYSNLEILLVDDGSTDESGELCDKFASNDPRIVVIHKKNEGVSVARNVGIQQATGAYIGFVDSDDYIHQEMLNSLYQQLIKEQADVSVCGTMNVYVNSMTPQAHDTELTFTCDAKGFLKEYLKGENIPGGIWNKLIKSEIAKAIAFPKGKIYEDAYYQYELIKLAKKYVVNTQPYYYYYHREGSLTTVSYNSQDLDCLDVYRQYYQYVMATYPDLEEEAFFRLTYAYFVVLDKILLQPNYQQIKEYKEVVTFLKRNAFKIVNNCIFRTGRRLAALALWTNVKLYRKLLVKNIEKSRQIHE